MLLKHWSFLIYVLILWRSEAIAPLTPVSCTITFTDSKGFPLKLVELRPKIVKKGIALAQRIDDIANEVVKNPSIKNVTLLCNGLVKFSNTTVCLRKGDSLKTCWDKYRYKHHPFTKVIAPKEGREVYGHVMDDPVNETISAKLFKGYRSARFIGPLTHLGPNKTYNALITYEGRRFNGRGIYFELKPGETINMKKVNFRISSYVHIGDARWFAYNEENFRGSAIAMGVPAGKQIIWKEKAKMEVKSFQSKFMKKRDRN